MIVDTVLFGGREHVVRVPLKRGSGGMAPRLYDSAHLSGF